MTGQARNLFMIPPSGALMVFPSVVPIICMPKAHPMIPEGRNLGITAKAQVMYMAAPIPSTQRKKMSIPILFEKPHKSELNEKIT